MTNDQRVEICGPNRKPLVFISLVGPDPETDAIFEKMKESGDREFGRGNYAFIDNPFGAWKNIKIGERTKKSFPARSRAHIQWGLFLDHILETVQPAYDSGVEYIISRKFGFDLIVTSLVHVLGVDEAAVTRTLALQKLLVRHHLIDQCNMTPPLYVFTTELNEAQARCREVYFAKEMGQTATQVAPHLTTDEKVRTIFEIMRSARLAQLPSVLVA